MITVGTRYHGINERHRLTRHTSAHQGRPSHRVLPRRKRIADVLLIQVLDSSDPLGAAATAVTAAMEIAEVTAVVAAEAAAVAAVDVAAAAVEVEDAVVVAEADVHENLIPMKKVYVTYCTEYERDELGATQRPSGISICADLEKLNAYIKEHSTGSIDCFWRYSEPQEMFVEEKQWKKMLKTSKTGVVYVDKMPDGIYKQA